MKKLFLIFICLLTLFIISCDEKKEISLEKTTSKIIDKIINKEIFIIKILKEIKKGLSH